MPETYYDPQPVAVAEASAREALSTRVLAFMVVAGILAAGLHSRVYPVQQGILIPVVMLYPWLIHAVARALLVRGRHPGGVNAAVLASDSLLLGVAVAAMHFALVPSLMLMMIMASSAMVLGGVQTFLVSLAVALLGMIIGAVLLGFHLLPYDETPALLVIVSVMGVGIYLAITAYSSQQQRETLLRAQQENRAQREQAIALARRLSKYLPPQVYGAIFSGRRDAKLETRRKKLTVFFSDVCGFTNLSDEIPLDQLTGILNQYLNEMTRIALKHGGTIDKFMGDGIMIFFGDPVSRGTREDAVACVSMAIEMQKQMQVLRQRWKEQGVNTPLEIRIGVNSGVCTVGNFGAESRMDYTILGREVNLASRLESSTSPGTILISETTHQLVKDTIQCRSKGMITVKGIQQALSVHEAIDFRRNLGGGANYVSVNQSGLTLMFDVEKIKNYEQTKVIDTLMNAVKIMRSTMNNSLNAEMTGFLLRLRNGEIDPEEREKLTHLVDKCAKKLRQKLA